MESAMRNLLRLIAAVALLLLLVGSIYLMAGPVR
jgi:hypothetical protein